MTKIKWFVLWGIVLITVPIVCNFIVLTSVRQYVNVAEGSKEWLAFLGSYTGAAISSVVSFVILWYNREDTLKIFKEELKNNMDRLGLEQIHTEINDIQKDIADRFARLDLDMFMNLSVICDVRKKLPTDDLARLQEMREKFKGMKYSADLLYKENCNESCYAFWSNYDVLMDNAIGLVEEYSQFIISIKNEKELTEKYRAKLFGFSNKANQINNEKILVLEYARAYLKCLISQLDTENKNIKSRINSTKL